MSWCTEMFSGVSVFVKDKDNPPKCPICEADLTGSLEWTFIHGVAECRCTAQFKTLNRNDKSEVLNEEPKCLVPAELIPKYHEAWVKANEKFKDMKYISDVKREERLTIFFELIKPINDEWDKTHPQKGVV